MPTKKYVIKIDILNGVNSPVWLGGEITGQTMDEVLSKLPLEISKILRKEHEAELAELKGDDDVPF